MAITRENIVDFMNEYYEVYSNCTAHPETVWNLDKYYDSKKGMITQYLTPKMSLEMAKFIPMVGKHPHIPEKLTPVDMVIDMDRMRVACIIRAELTPVETGIVKEWWFMAFYGLMANEKGELRINDFHVMAEGPEPGGKTIMEFLGFEAFVVD